MSPDLRASRVKAWRASREPKFLVNVFDETAMRLAGGLAQHSEMFDRFVVSFLALPTVKLLPLVACLWYLWFSSERPERTKLAVLLAGAGSLVALFLSRLVQNLGPARPRPLHAGLADFVAPFGVDVKTLENWSSFPSDNAALSFAIATGVAYGSRRLGGFCYAWALFVVCLPRVYSGYHYASDILAGAVLGVASVALLPARALGAAMLTRVGHWDRKHRNAFYAAAFVVSYQLVTMFADIRRPLAALLP
jgi:undecaprenyl-diphosphatase